MPVPAYNGGSIANLMSSLVSGLGGEKGTCAPLSLLAAAEIASFRNVCLLVIDGLGHEYLRAHPEANWLNGHLRGRITSVFPSTTATAITTFLTGEPPSRHGLTGWHMYFRELGSVLAVLPGRARYGGVGLSEAGVAPSVLFDQAAVFDRVGVESVVLSPAQIAHSDFNQAHLGRGKLRPFRGLEAMLDIVVELARDSRERRFIYGYWPELDGLGHTDGMNSEASVRHLRQIDRALATCATALAGTGTLLVVTADHGQIDILDSDRISLDDHPELSELLVLPLCGESRTAYSYVRPHRAGAFERYVIENLSHAVDLHVSRDLVDLGWFGPGDPHPRLLERIGDYTLVMRDHFVIKDWLPHEKKYELTGVHGGMTPDEMYVPVVLKAC